MMSDLPTLKYQELDREQANQWTKTFFSCWRVNSHANEVLSYTSLFLKWGQEEKATALLINSFKDPQKGNIASKAEYKVHSGCGTNHMK